MRRATSNVVVNLALAVGIVAAVAIAVAFTMSWHDSRPASPGKKSVYLRLPPFQEPAPAASAEALRPTATLEPFEPPAPPTVEVIATATPRRPAREQVAALNPAEAVPPLAAPPLETVELGDRAVRAVPSRDKPMRKVTIVNRQPGTAPAEHAAPKPQGEASPSPRHQQAALYPTPAQADKEKEGVRFTGLAIVTAGLEMNVAGKPLRLFGVKLPAKTDICAPSPDYAARACPDVSRQALAVRVGTDGEVSCRILATGGRETLPALCTDSSGTDLATYLVEHGFALADPNDMVDYSAAETQAKNARSGLWSYR
jgi:endonuclease YncB( thermonuclease family)